MLQQVDASRRYYGPPPPSNNQAATPRVPIRMLSIHLRVLIEVLVACTDSDAAICKQSGAICKRSTTFYAYMQLTSELRLTATRFTLTCNLRATYAYFSEGVSVITLMHNFRVTEGTYTLPWYLPQPAKPQGPHPLPSVLSTHY